MPSDQIYKHILYATDLGPSEKLIRKKVKSVRAQNKCNLSIVHIVESIPVFIDMSGYLNTAEIIEQMQKEASIMLDKICQDLDIQDTNCHIKVGSPKADIVSLAKEIKADLIVLGAHNRHLIDNLIGSTTDAVLRSAECDVLTVRFKQD